jgi:hypothetical protein
LRAAIEKPAAKQQQAEAGEIEMIARKKGKKLRLLNLRRRL